MLATTTNLNRFLNKAERIIRNDYNEKGLIVCARIDNVFAINYNDIPFILSVSVAPFNVIVYSIALSSDSKNYIINSRGTCGNQEDVISDIYVDLLHYVRDNNICLETAETAEKQYADYTSEDFIKAGIAKECTDCPDFCEEDCNENAECASGNDVFDGCKKSQYFDTDALQPNKKIENINHCPNQNTCCIVSPFVHCNYNYKSDSCIKAHKNFIHDCEQVHKQMKAKSNPEWHHVSLATLANIDIDMLDEKRQRYFKIYKELKKTVNDLYTCKTAATYETRWWRFKQVIADDICYSGTTLYMTRFLDSKISMCNVECGLWSSADEKATSFIKSRRYGSTTLK